MNGRVFKIPAGRAAVCEDERLALCAVHGNPAYDGSSLVAYDVEGADLSRVRHGTVPVLLEHMRHADHVLGSVAEAWLEDGALHCLQHSGASFNLP